MRKICFVTGTRADYGIMAPLMLALRDEPGVELQIIATNMHLNADYGLTYREIEADGLTITRKVPMPVGGDSATECVRATGIAMQGFADAFTELQPDVAVILGDRYEMLAAASAAQIMGVPIAHLHGGEITEGAVDDAIRHAITKLSLLHFTSTEEYRQRVIQMGEDPGRVFNVGSLAVEQILSDPVLPLKELNASLSEQTGREVRFAEGEYLLVTFHPATREPGQAAAQTRALLAALTSYLLLHTSSSSSSSSSLVPRPTSLLITLPNSDAEGKEVREQMLNFAKAHPENVIAVPSLGRKRYYSALKHCRAVVGNSSSGIIEAPSFGKPTVNIGSRQQGRAQSNTVINCPADEEAIFGAIRKACEPLAVQAVNPYEGKDTLSTVKRILCEYSFRPHEAKHFHDLSL